MRWGDDETRRLVHEPCHLIDIMGTAVDVSGALYPAEFKGHRILPMEGVSLRPALAGEALHRVKPIFWMHEGNRAVRSGPWKAVMKFKGRDPDGCAALPLSRASSVLF